MSRYYRHSYRHRRKRTNYKESGLESFLGVLIYLFVLMFKVIYWILALIIKLIVVLVEYITHRPIVRGRIGEKKVYNMLLDIMDDEDEIFSNLILETASGYTSQLDHILISKKGIFVIEVKNYSGKIYGNDNSEYWRQYLGSKYNELYSPVKQNFTHIYELKRLIGEEYKDKIINAVVFVDGNINKVDSKFTYKMRSFEDKYFDDDEEILIQEQIDSISSIIKQYQEDHKISDREHVKNVKRKQKDINNNICPRCGAPLVLINTDNGDRYKCSNDGCDFIRKVK